MAHFAQIDENNIVINVIVVSNNELLDENNIEQEELGISFCKSLYGEDTNWVQTSWNTFQNTHKDGGTPFRKNYAGIGMTWRPDLDGFVGEKLYPSWTLNEETCDYEPPVPYPQDGKYYVWDEQNQMWNEMEI
jgi:hypothetical protein